MAPPPHKRHARAANAPGQCLASRRRSILRHCGLVWLCIWSVGYIVFFHRVKTSNYYEYIQYYTNEKNYAVVPAPKASSATPLNFANWSTSEESLSTLRAIQDRLDERSFHEATHLLYDLRSTLGNRPVKYLEIGSYTGISASLMLMHPMPTFVTMVDPCLLPTHHYRGKLGQEETIRNNVQLHAKQTCDVRSPWLIHVGFSPDALPVGETFDIIFIDGDHSTDGVWADYHNTIHLLRDGGFMVFDDYLDAKDSPDVRGAVDEIAKATELIPIGSPRNVHGIHPEVNASFLNEYVFQKKGFFEYRRQEEPTHHQDGSIVLCVCVATYKRPDGSTPAKLEKLWSMLQSQSYTNWELYLTGDNYDNHDELASLTFYNDSNVHIFDLPEPGERGKTVFGKVLRGRRLWHHAGMTAMNNAIQRSLADGHEWVVHLDDDDHWDTDHLQNIVDGIYTGATFVMTRCEFKPDFVLPRIGLSTHIRHDVLPEPCNVVHASVAFNAAKLPSRYEFTALPADASLWSRIVYDDAFFPAFVPVTSCHYDGGNTFVRKSLLGGPVPNGWRDSSLEYDTLATDVFPQTPSPKCEFVVGPAEGHPDFYMLDKHDIPYHIRIVEAFDRLPVWGRQKYEQY